MQKVLLGIATFALSVSAMAYPQISKSGEETFEKYELYDESGKGFSVEVDYARFKACGQDSLYLLSQIDESSVIITKHPLVRRAFCPPPEQWEVVQSGIKFEVKPRRNGLASMNVMVPKGAKVKVREADYNANLPNGLLSLDLAVNTTYGSTSGFNINVSGELNSPNVNLVVGDPQIDASTRTVIVPIKADPMGFDGLTAAVTSEFSVSYDVITYVEGTWTVVLVDEKGKSLRKEQVDVFLVSHGR